MTEPHIYMWDICEKMSLVNYNSHIIKIMRPFAPAQIHVGRYVMEYLGTNSWKLIVLKVTNNLHTIVSSTVIYDTGKGGWFFCQHLFNMYFLKTNPDILPYSCFGSPIITTFWIWAIGIWREYVFDLIAMSRKQNTYGILRLHKYCSKNTLYICY